MTIIDKLNEQRETYARAFKSIEAILSPVAEKLPDVCAYFSPGYGDGLTANVEFLVSRMMAENGKELFLSMIGEAMGTDGWERHEGYDRDKFDWKKRVGDVQITIRNAELAPKITVPVPPSAFPIALMESTKIEA